MDRRSKDATFGAPGMASSNKCLTSSDKKLLETRTLLGTSATLVVTSALLVVTRTLLGAKGLTTGVIGHYVRGSWPYYQERSDATRSKGHRS